MTTGESFRMVLVSVAIVAAFFTGVWCMSGACRKCPKNEGEEEGNTDLVRAISLLVENDYAVVRDSRHLYRSKRADPKTGVWTLLDFNEAGHAIGEKRFTRLNEAATEMALLRDRPAEGEHGKEKTK